MEEFSEKISQSLLKEGASLVGFADIKNVSPDFTDSFPFAISVDSQHF